MLLYQPFHRKCSNVFCAVRSDLYSQASPYCICRTESPAILTHSFAKQGVHSESFFPTAIFGNSLRVEDYQSTIILTFSFLESIEISTRYRRNIYFLLRSYHLPISIIIYRMWILDIVFLKKHNYIFIFLERLVLWRYGIG